NAFKINLTIAQRAEPARPVYPILKTTVHTTFPRWIKLGILHMEHFDVRMIEINVLQIVQLLQHKMTWIVQDVYTWMVPRLFQKPFESDAIMQILTGVYLVAHIHSSLVK